MTLGDGLLILHITAVFVLVGGVAIATATAVTTMGKRDVRTIAAAAGLMHRAELWLVVPGAVLAAVFGTWLVSEQGRSFGESWVSLSYTLWLIVLGLVTGVLGRHARVVARRAREAVDRGEHESAEIAELFADPKVRTVSLAVDVLLLVLLYLMVVRPGA